MRFQVLWVCLVLAVPTAFVGAVQAEAQSCGSGYYRNSAGNCILVPRRPGSGQTQGVLGGSNVPAGATARCRDGTYSYSQSRRGTCSGHGGVASWL
jgi:hypothetical protein